MEQWLSFLILKEKERTRGSKRNHQERHGGIVSRQSEHSGVQSEPAEKGKYGSEIHWISGHERFLDTEGNVRRPAYGTGDRIISLWAEFFYKGVSETKEYKVCILEEKQGLK